MLAAALALASCAGGGVGDDEEIVGAIETAFVKTNPRSCTEAMTQTFVEQRMAIEGAGAVEWCESNARAEESDNPPVRVTGVGVDGDAATAEVHFSGGEIAGQTALVALVEDGGWKLDAVIRFTEFDKVEVADAMAKAYEGGESPADPRTVVCIRAALGKLSRAGLEEIMLGGSYQSLIEVEERCG